GALTSIDTGPTFTRGMALPSPRNGGPRRAPVCIYKVLTNRASLDAVEGVEDPLSGERVHGGLVPRPRRPIVPVGVVVGRVAEGARVVPAGVVRIARLLDVERVAERPRERAEQYDVVVAVATF